MHTTIHSTMHTTIHSTMHTTTHSTMHTTIHPTLHTVHNHIIHSTLQIIYTHGPHPSMHPCCTHKLIQNSDVHTYMQSHDTPSPRSPWRRGSQDGCPSTWLGSGGWPTVRTTGDVCREVVRHASVCLKAQAPYRQTVSPPLTYVRMCTHQMLIQLQCDWII